VHEKEEEKPLDRRKLLKEGEKLDCDLSALTMQAGTATEQSGPEKQSSHSHTGVPSALTARVSAKTLPFPEHQCAAASWAA
jgi:hypothetical protein